MNVDFRRLFAIPGVLRSTLAMVCVAVGAALFAMAMSWSLPKQPGPFINTDPTSMRESPVQGGG